MDGTDTTRDAEPRPIVLIVDDDEQWGALLELVLELDGFRVASAHDGREALALLERGLQPAVVVLDLHLPELDGWGFLKEWAAHNGPSAPVCVASSVSGAAAPRADKVLEKPLPVSELLAFVREAAGR